MTLEVIVRPLVLPDTRPSARDARSDDPERGRATIGGGGGQAIDLTHTFSSNTSKQHQSEEYRVFDIVRTFRVFTNAAGQEEIDSDTFIDTEVMWQIITVLHTGETRRMVYRRPLAEDYPKGNVAIIERDIIRKTKGPGTLVDLILP